MNDLPNGATFNDLEWPLTLISRSWHFSTLTISETTRVRAIDPIVLYIERQQEVDLLYALSRGDIKFCKHLLLYEIHLWADLDHDRRVGGSRPNQN